MLTQAGAEYSSDTCLTDDIILLPINAPANAYNPIRIADVPLKEVNRDDFSIIALISLIVSSASLFFIFKSTLKCKVKYKKLKSAH